jgi:hypothetical protein
LYQMVLVKVSFEHFTHITACDDVCWLSQRKCWGMLFFDPNKWK